MQLPRFVLLSLAFLAALLTGCASTPPAKLSHSQDFAPVYPVAPPKNQVATGAIFNARNSDNWFGRGKTYQVGDIITLHLNERTSANRTANSKLGRKANNDVIPQGMIDRISGLALPGKVLGTRLEGALSGVNLSNSNIGHESTGNLDDKLAVLQGALTVTVIEVLQNGNLVVRGEKQMAITDGAEIIQISGIIRPTDISPGNMVQSSRLANAQFSYRSTGALADATSPGWGTKLLMNIWPF
jgi:flagellar L-ring protein precursor FlgH